MKQEATPDGVSAELQIRMVDASDSGPYFCRASNLYGNDQQLVQLQVQEPPQPPTVLEAAMISSRSVNLKWQPKTVNTADISKYIVEFKEMDRKLQIYRKILGENYYLCSNPSYQSQGFENLVGFNLNERYLFV